MSASSSSLTFNIFGKDVSASKAINSIGKEAGSAGKNLGSMGKIAGGVFAGGVLQSAASKAVSFAEDTLNAFGDVGSATLKLQRYTGGTAESMSRLAAVGRETGVDTDQLAKGLGFLSKNLASNSDAAKSLGINYRDAHGNILPMDQLLPQISQKFADMPNGPEKTALVLKLFGKAGMDLLPMLNKGAAGIAQLEEESDKLGTTLSGSDLDAVKQNTVAKRQWGEALKGLQITIGRELYPILTQFANFLTTTVVPAVRTIIDWLKEHKDIVEKVAVVIGALVGGLFAFVKVVSMVSAVVRAYTAVQAALNVVMAANPVGIIIIAVIALIGIIVLLWNKCEWFRNAVTAVWEAIKTAVSAVVDWFMANVWPTLSKIWEAIVIGAKWLWEKLTAYWSFMWNVIRTVVEWIAENVWPKIQTVWTYIAVGARVLWNALTTYWSFMWNIIRTVVEWIAVNVWPKIQVVWNYVSNGVRILWSVLTTYWGFMFNVIKTVVEWIAVNVWPKVQAVWNFVSAGIRILWSVWSAVWSAIWNVITTVIGWIVANVWPKIKAVWDFVTGGLRLLFSIFQTVWSAIWNKVISPVVNWIRDHIINNFERIKVTAQIIWDTVKNTVTTAISTVKGILSSIGEKVGEVIGFFARIKDGIVERVSAVKDFLTGLPGRIVSWIGGVAGTLWQKGVDLIQGFINGIIAKAGDIVGTIQSWVIDKIPDVVKKALGISSPSKVMYALGLNVSQGLADGIRAGAGDVHGAMGGLIGSTDLSRSMSVTVPRSRFAGASSGATGAPGAPVINVTVNGALDPVRTAQEIRKVLLQYKRETGVSLGVA